MQSAHRVRDFACSPWQVTYYTFDEVLQTKAADFQRVYRAASLFVSRCILCKCSRHMSFLELFVSYLFISRIPMNFGALVIAGIIDTHKNKQKAITYGALLIHILEQKGIDLSEYGGFYEDENQFDLINLKKMSGQRKIKRAAEAAARAEEEDDDDESTHGFETGESSRAYEPLLQDQILSLRLI